MCFQLGADAEPGFFGMPGEEGGGKGKKGAPQAKRMRWRGIKIS